jgi:hypothetical protein
VFRPGTFPLAIKSTWQADRLAAQAADDNASGHVIAGEVVSDEETHTAGWSIYGLTNSSWSSLVGLVVVDRALDGGKTTTILQPHWILWVWTIKLLLIH